MRWAMITLLFANLAYFSWSQSQSDAPERGPDSNQLPPGADHSEVPSPTLLSAAPDEALESGRQAGSSVPFLSPAAPHAGARCWLIGPLSEKVTAKQVQLRFHDQGLMAEILSNPRPGDRGYAVFLQRSRGIERAREQVRQLQLAGYASARLLQDGGGYRVQVGHYTERELADETRAALSSAGFTTALQEQFSEISQLLLRVVLAPGQEVSEELWQGLERDFPRYPREQNWCGPIASVG